MVDCPVCGKAVKQRDINVHLDSGCQEFVDEVKATQNVASFFHTPGRRAHAALSQVPEVKREEKSSNGVSPASSNHGVKRGWEDGRGVLPEDGEPAAKKSKTASNLTKVAPLADRMRPTTLDDVSGQDLVAPSGLIRSLIAQDRVPSMILWGGPGTGKTTIARLIAHASSARFFEINSTSTGVGECKKLFAQALNELQLTGRKTIIFCDEIHRFSKSQQDVFLGPVEAGTITLIGATTENPSFKVINALLSRCRVFTLSPLTEVDIKAIMGRALALEFPKGDLPNLLLGSQGDDLLDYLAISAAGDARTALNLLELAISLSTRGDASLESLKKSLTHTLIYDRQGDAHYDTISALHKSIRGSNPDAALYYLARMLASGEDPLYISRRLIVIASEDVGLADNAMLPLAIATHSAVEKVGLPEARINLGHCVVALSLAKKSTRAYRALGAAMKAVQDPAIGALPVPIHLRNAPTRLMKEIGYGEDYKYNPEYVDGKVKQDYLPDALKDTVFLDDRDFGAKIDQDLENEVNKEEIRRSSQDIQESDYALVEQDSGLDTRAGEIEDEYEERDVKANSPLDEGLPIAASPNVNGEERVEEEDELWEQNASGEWMVRKSSQ